MAPKREQKCKQNAGFMSFYQNKKKHTPYQTPLVYVTVERNSFDSEKEIRLAE